MKVPDQFLSALESAHDLPWMAELRSKLEVQYRENVHGDMPKWEQALAALPRPSRIKKSLNTSGVGFETDEEILGLEALLKTFHPWRKGPFQLGQTFIDTEWRSDWKWDRLVEGIESLSGKAVLDIGCGSGYHLWRMLGEGARWAIGLEPVHVYVYQFAVLQHFLGFEDRAAVLGLPFEPFPQSTQFFDAVFSMGVLYHRKSPIEHLEAVRDSLAPGGQLILETLVVEGNEHTVLVPNGRYAQMRNVWFLPSVKMLTAWMKRLRFKDVQVLDVTRTTTEEQRTTDWMTFDSLKKFLDPSDSAKTIEGYPGPLRAIITARA
ncbi:MAG: tRNA 5-methoxyuridine(34)/uridine 5-oxyacetic acid(34) synthase CmoB [Opitutales bacterium]